MLTLRTVLPPGGCARLCTWKGTELGFLSAFRPSRASFLARVSARGTRSWLLRSRRRLSCWATISARTSRGAASQASAAAGRGAFRINNSTADGGMLGSKASQPQPHRRAENGPPRPQLPQNELPSGFNTPPADGGMLGSKASQPQPQRRAGNGPPRPQLRQNEVLLGSTPPLLMEACWAAYAAFQPQLQRRQRMELVRLSRAGVTPQVI